MIYIAQVLRNGLIKIGKSLNPHVREKQLQRELKAKGLKIFRAIHVPFGWGTDRLWESELLWRARGGKIQLFSASENSTEVVDCSPQEAWALLNEMLARTEIDIGRDAPEHDDEKLDWRFYRFQFGNTFEAVRHHAPLYWRSLCHRQRFIDSLRDKENVLIPREFLEIDLKKHELCLCAMP